MDAENAIAVDIRKLGQTSEIEACARMMSGSEPWITLRRGYAASVKILSIPSREIYLAVADSEITGFILLNMQGAFIGYIQTVCCTRVERQRNWSQIDRLCGGANIPRNTQRLYVCLVL